MDDKGTYSDGVQERRHRASEDQLLAKAIEAGEYRVRTYGENWQSVNINEVIARIAPGSTPEYSNGKMYFYNQSRTIAVVADIGGGYLRIQDMRKRGRRRYLDLFGRDASNYTDAKGRQHGRTQAQYNAATHFRILKRKEM